MPACVLRRNFFARDTREVARDLVGAVLEVDGVTGRIVETEAYRGDPASHFVTRRKAAALMGTTHGRLYVYGIYGMHHCANVTTEVDGPGAVLLRAVEPLTGVEEMRGRRGGRPDRDLARGPANLVVAFGIRPEWTGRPFDEVLTIRERDRPVDVVTGPRVGIARAVDLPWRFMERGSRYVSKSGAPQRRSATR